jgi:hypothetical protein
MARIGAKALGAILTGKKPAVLEVNKVRRYQKRKKRRVFEATEQDWARWDAEAKLQGLSFSEFVRRSLHGACEVAIMRRATFIGGEE